MGNLWGTNTDDTYKLLILKKKVVGVAGFEPTTTTPPVWCATRLRYTPYLWKQIRRSSYELSALFQEKFTIF